MNPEEQIADIKSRCRAVRQTMVRELDGGYIIAGSTQYLNPQTNMAELTTNAERVAATADSATAASGNYLKTGTFDGAVEAAPAAVV